MGVSTKRGPISTREILVSPRWCGASLGVLVGFGLVGVDSCSVDLGSDFEMAVSLIW